ncbi:MAG: META domain-containing protein [Rhizobiales bacterium]|nr:META domain-containing protein [Hyphomicrobiales bacterium]
MARRRHTFAWSIHGLWPLAACLLFYGAVTEASAKDKTFPYDHELRYDTNPQRGSKRIPGLQISKDGAAEIDLWCVSGKGQAVIVDKSFTIVPTAMQDNQCPQDRLRMDEELLTTLTQVTSWKWEGNLLVLLGPKPLRFRPASN